MEADISIEIAISTEMIADVQDSPTEYFRYFRFKVFAEAFQMLLFVLVERPG